MIPAFVTKSLAKHRRHYYNGLRALALVDGVHYQNHTGRKLESREGLSVSLFAHTKDIALAHAGPWLVDASRAQDCVADLSELEEEQPAVIWLVTQCNIEDQAAKLRPYLSVVAPNRKSALLRFWDPRVIHTLDEIYNSQQERELFKTAVEWLYLHEGQRLSINGYAKTE
jgi:hypothetical protein